MSIAICHSGRSEESILHTTKWFINIGFLTSFEMTWHIIEVLVNNISNILPDSTDYKYLNII